MSPPAAPTRAEQRDGLYAERNRIERRHYDDLRRLREIRDLIDGLADEPRDG